MKIKDILATILLGGVALGIAGCGNNADDDMGATAATTGTTGDMGTTGGTATTAGDTGMTGGTAGTPTTGG